MHCPYPVTIKNPAIEQHGGVLLGVQSDGNYLYEDGELVPGTIQVPCGHCIICQNARRDMWAARMQLENLDHVCGWFCTLTYNEDNCPPFLCRADLTKWLKRVRKRYQVRYFACGEYGSQGQRPHFHVILWFDTVVQQHDIDDLLNVTWFYGFTQAKPVNSDNMRYVAKYTVKEHLETPPVFPSPYAVMSRRPGIAGPWFASNSKYFHDFLALPDGKHSSLPRYFMDKLDPVEQIQIKRHSREFAESLPVLSDTDKYLRLTNLERSVYRSYIRKYGK